MSSPESIEYCRHCKYSKVVRANGDFTFTGCFKPPLKGKWVSEIPFCEQRAELKKEVDDKEKDSLDILF